MLEVARFKLTGFCFCWQFLTCPTNGVENSNVRDHLVIYSFSIGLNHLGGWGQKSLGKKNPFSKPLPLPAVVLVCNRGNNQDSNTSTQGSKAFPVEILINVLKMRSVVTDSLQKRLGLPASLQTQCKIPAFQASLFYSALL